MKSKDTLQRDVATGIVMHKGKILLMKRNLEKRWYPGKWENAGGGIRQGEPPAHAALRETYEETGLKCRVIKGGKIFEVKGYGLVFVVHPFLLEAESDKVRLSIEHTEYAWIDVKGFEKYDCVDGIELDYISTGLITEKQ